VAGGAAAEAARCARRGGDGAGRALLVEDRGAPPPEAFAASADPRAPSQDELRKAYKKSKWQPLDLRRKATRAIRRRLTVKEATAKTLRTKKRMSYFPIRKYAVKA
jgi:hypothetical protein